MPWYGHLITWSSIVLMFWLGLNALSNRPDGADAGESKTVTMQELWEPKLLIGAGTEKPRKYITLDVLALTADRIEFKYTSNWPLRDQPALLSVKRKDVNHCPGTTSGGNKRVYVGVSENPAPFGTQPVCIEGVFVKKIGETYHWEGLFSGRMGTKKEWWLNISLVETEVAKVGPKVEEHWDEQMEAEKKRVYKQQKLKPE